MNVGDIRLRLFDRLGYASSPDSAVVRRMTGFIDEVHREILGKRGMAVLRRKILTCTSVADSPYMVLPQAAVNIAVIADRTNGKNLDLMSIQDVRARDPRLNFTGTIPDGYAVINMNAPVALDPTAAAELFVISDSTGDGAGISATVHGITSSGYPRVASIAMNGTTGVSLDTTITDWLQIQKWFLSAQAKGTVTLRMTSGAGTTLGTITPGRSSARYTQLHLSPTPSSALTYHVDCEVHVENLLAPNDEPLLPEDFHDLLVLGALMKEYHKRKNYPAVQAIEGMAGGWTERWNDLQAFVRRSQGIARGPNRKNQGFSQLGPMFPAGS